MAFDMDGVLLRSMQLHYRAWQRAGASLGIRIDRGRIFRHEGEPGTTTVQWLAAPQYRQVLLRRKERHFAQWKHRIRPYAGAMPLLRRIARTPLKLGLVTGTSRSELLAVLPRQMLRLFDASVTGDEVPHGKPDPAPYRKICRILRVRPAEVLVVENAPFGVQAARRARIGCVVALATTVSPRTLRGAHIVFRSLHELAAWLRRTHLLRSS